MLWWTWVDKFLRLCFQSVWIYISRSRIARSYGNSIFKHFNYCKWCCDEHGWTNLSSKLCFIWCIPSISRIARSRGSSVFNFLKNTLLFSQQLYHFTFSPPVHNDSVFSASLPMLIFFLIVAILAGVRWYLIEFWFPFPWWWWWASFHSFSDL